MRDSRGWTCTCIFSSGSVYICSHTSSHAEFVTRKRLKCYVGNLPLWCDIFVQRLPRIFMKHTSNHLRIGPHTNQKRVRFDSQHGLLSRSHASFFLREYFASMSNMGKESRLRILLVFYQKAFHLFKTKIFHWDSIIYCGRWPLYFYDII